jgi:hypothetical protein
MALRRYRQNTVVDWANLDALWFVEVAIAFCACLFVDFKDDRTFLN